MTKKKSRKPRTKRTLKDVVGEGATLRAILDAANAHYPDGILTEFFHGDGPDDAVFDEEASGDTLAEAIVTNIIDTYQRDGTALEKVDAALHVIDRLVEDLNLAEKGLVALRERIEPGGLDEER